MADKEHPRPNFLAMFQFLFGKLRESGLNKTEAHEAIKESRFYKELSDAEIDAVIGGQSLPGIYDDDKPKKRN